MNISIAGRGSPCVTSVELYYEIPSHCSFTCAGVAVPSAVERKELLQFPVVKEVPSEP